MIESVNNGQIAGKVFTDFLGDAIHLHSGEVSRCFIRPQENIPLDAAHLDGIQLISKEANRPNGQYALGRIASAKIIDNVVEGATTPIQPIFSSDGIIEYADIQGNNLTTDGSHFITLNGLLSGNISGNKFHNVKEGNKPIKLYPARVGGNPDGKGNIWVLSFKGDTEYLPIETDQPELVQDFRKIAFNETDTFLENFDESKFDQMAGMVESSGGRMMGREFQKMALSCGDIVSGKLNPEELKGAGAILGLPPMPDDPVRDITDISIHCSATPAGRDVSVETIRSWHIDRGWHDIGYHFVIGLNGEVSGGRSVKDAPAAVRGHNWGMIAICYVGGISAETMQPEDTRTQAQRDSLIELLSQLKSEYPHAKIKGHNNYPGVKKACPCFDAEAEYLWIGNEEIYFQDPIEVIKSNREKTGIEKPVKSLWWSRIIQGGLAALTGTGGLGWIGVEVQDKVGSLVEETINDPVGAIDDLETATLKASEVIDRLNEINQWLTYGAFTVAALFVAVALVLYARRDDRKRLIN